MADYETRKYMCECGCSDCENRLTATTFGDAAFYGFLQLHNFDPIVNKAATVNLSRGQAICLATQIYKGLTVKERKTFINLL